MAKKITKSEFVNFVNKLGRIKRNIEWDHQENGYNFQFLARKTLQSTLICPICRKNDNVHKKKKCKNNKSYFSCTRCKLKIYISKNKWRKLSYSLKNLLPFLDVILSSKKKVKSLLDTHSCQCFICGARLYVKNTVNKNRMYFSCGNCEMNGFVPDDKIANLVLSRVKVKKDDK